MSGENPRHTSHHAEPDYLPSQAEGDDQPEILTEHLRTPGKAEGDRQASEETLTRQPAGLRQPEADRSLWRRVKSLFGK